MSAFDELGLERPRSSHVNLKEKKTDQMYLKDSISVVQSADRQFKILTRQSSKNKSVNTNINDGSIPLIISE